MSAYCGYFWICGLGGQKKTAAGTPACARADGRCNWGEICRLPRGDRALGPSFRLSTAGRRPEDKAQTAVTMTACQG